MYKNGGGQFIQEEIARKLKDRDIHVIPELNLANAMASDGHIFCKKVPMEELDLYFSYNAGKQTQYQMYLYQTLNESVPCINNYNSFALTEDKFRTSHKLTQAGIVTPQYKMLKRGDKKKLKKAMQDWGGKLIYKPTDGWGGMGIVKIENERSLDMLFPFLDQTNIPYFYIEKYINYDMTDFRIDVVDGEYVSCYGRQAPSDSWKTNVTSGGSIMLREPSDEAVELAIKAAGITGLEIAGVDLIYDLEKEQYVVLEVNGIPAFATPEQQVLGLDFNHIKINKIVDLITNKVIENNVLTLQVVGAE
jgi:ribosomal protein S6--L-glutamate ligase